MSKNTNQKVGADMKIAVVNFSGNVGKSTIARYLLQRHMKSEVFSIESINKSQFDSIDDSEVTTLKAKQFSALQEAMLLNDSLIVDVGSSNIEELMNQMRSYSGSQHDFDYFLVPVIAKDKQISDTLATIGTLIENFDIEPKKIKVVYNMVESPDTVDFDFDKIKTVFDSLKVKNNTAFLLATDYYNKVETLVGNSVYKNKYKSKLIDLDFMADNVDLFQKELTEIRTAVKNEADTGKKAQLTSDMRELAQLIQLARLAITVRDNVDDAFKALF